MITNDDELAVARNQLVNAETHLAELQEDPFADSDAFDELRDAHAGVIRDLQAQIQAYTGEPMPMQGLDAFRDKLVNLVNKAAQDLEGSNDPVLDCPALLERYQVSLEILDYFDTMVG